MFWNSYRNALHMIALKSLILCLEMNKAAIEEYQVIIEDYIYIYIMCI